MQSPVLCHERLADLLCAFFDTLAGELGCRYNHGLWLVAWFCAERALEDAARRWLGRFRDDTREHALRSFDRGCFFNDFLDFRVFGFRCGVRGDFLQDAVDFGIAFGFTLLGVFGLVVLGHERIELGVFALLFELLTLALGRALCAIMLFTDKFFFFAFRVTDDFFVGKTTQFRRDFSDLKSLFFCGISHDF